MVSAFMEPAGLLPVEDAHPTLSPDGHKRAREPAFSDLASLHGEVPGPQWEAAWGQQRGVLGRGFRQSHRDQRSTAFTHSQNRVCWFSIAW